MSQPKKDTPPPRCAECDGAAVLVSGKDVYPHRPDLYEKPIWRCACGARVGCHPGGTVPLGTPARGDLRNLRMRVHAMFDPLWRRAGGKGKARRRAYAWLADMLDAPDGAVHVGEMDREQCYTALRILMAVQRGEISGPRS